MIFLFFCLKFLKVIFQREDIKLGCIDIHLLNFSNFDFMFKFKVNRLKKQMPKVIDIWTDC